MAGVDRRRTRRQFLATVGGAGAAVAVTPLLWRFSGAAAATSWHDAVNWTSGSVPGPGDLAIVRGDVVLEGDVTVAGVVVPAGSSLTFAPDSSVRLESTGNVIVEGRLTMRPSAAATHVLAFANVVEHAFVGKGLVPIPTDTGLWVVEAGVLDVAGSARRPWARAAGSCPPGTTVVPLVGAPEGWAAGDEVVVTPTEPSTGFTKDPYWSHFEAALLAEVAADAVVLDRPLVFDHPLVSTGRGDFGAELLNLTRNVRIEGTPGGRSHVFIRSSAPQFVSDVQLRHMGPRHADGTKVLGRWPLHIHHCFEASRGSVYSSVVVRDAGSHAFVVHASHGVTFAGCVAYDVEEHAYWWDEGDATDDAVYDGCVAARVRNNDVTNKFGVDGFYLAEGDRNTIRNCVATGVWGSSGAGFAMPGAFANGRWTVVDCLAHNNRNAGFAAYINTAKRDTKTVTGFIAYHNDVGIQHGAYLNAFRYESCTAFANPRGGVELRAVANTDAIRFVGLLVDQAGRGDHGVVNKGHVSAGALPTRFEGCTFQGHRVAGVGLVVVDAKVPDRLEVVDCVFGGNEFWLGDAVHPGCQIAFTQGGTTQTVVRRDQPGHFVPGWNAAVR